MRPPECAACGEMPEGDARAWETVTFADYEPLPDGMTGHPRGMEWFCPKHLEKAKTLTHLPTRDAIDAIC